MPFAQEAKPSPSPTRDGSQLPMDPDTDAPRFLGWPTRSRDGAEQHRQRLDPLGIFSAARLTEEVLAVDGFTAAVSSGNERAEIIFNAVRAVDPIPDPLEAGAPLHLRSRLHSPLPWFTGTSLGGTRRYRCGLLTGVLTARAPADARRRRGTGLPVLDAALGSASWLGNSMVSSWRARWISTWSSGRCRSSSWQPSNARQETEQTDDSENSRAGATD